MTAQPFLPIVAGNPWVFIADGDARARAIFDRHYSRRRYGDGRKPKLFVGPGEKLVMITADLTALFVWRKFKADNDQTGVNCAVFRNEGYRGGHSSDLIIAADDVAFARWPGERHYTYVNPRQVRSTNPGCCFKKAGWVYCGVTKKRSLHILERAA